MAYWRFFCWGRRGIKMKKRLMLLGIIVALMMGYYQMVAQADVGGSFSSSSSSSGGSSSSSGRGPTYRPYSHLPYRRRYGSNSPIVLVVMGGLVVGGLLKRFNHHQQQKNESRIALARMCDVDPTFEEDDFLNKVQDIFLSVQEAWSLRDMRFVQDVETSGLFRLHQSQLERYHQKNWTPHVETQRITEVRLVSFSETINEVSLVVCLSARVVDYTSNRDGLVVEGEKGKIQHRDYRLRFTRPKENIQDWRLDDYREWMENEFLRYQ